MPSSPKFFRIVLQRNLEDPKLMIRKKFVEDCGKLLSSSVSLKLSDGKEWKVGLRTAGNGAVWLEKGWDKFSDHYCLEVGSMLVFKLLDGRRSSSFDVTIFDPSGVETKYFCDSDFSAPEPEDDSDSDSDSDSVESLESFHGHSKKRKKASVPCRQSRRKTRKKEESFTIKTEPEEEEEGCNNILRDIPSRKKRMRKEEVARKKQQVSNEAETTQRFNSKSDQKPCFKIAMGPSNVGGRFNMVIPNGFAVKYLSEKFGLVKIQTTNGRKFPLLYKWCRSSRANYAYISSGWKRFAEENYLKEGDVAFFQLIKKQHFLFTKLQDTSPSFPSYSPKKETATTTRKSNPFFEVDFKSCKNSCLNIPLTLSKMHFSPQMESAKLQVGNKQWDVTLKQYEGYVRFSAGWSTFRGDNGLEDGDTCLFEMVSKMQCVFKVSIFKKVSSSSFMDWNNVNAIQLLVDNVMTYA